MQRYREAAKAQSENQGQLSWEELNSVYVSARLHEVQCLCTPFRNHCPGFAPCIRQMQIASGCGRNMPG